MKQKYIYRIQQLPRDHPNTIRMYPELIDEGYFKKLSFSAISVYFAMRGLASKVEKEANWVKAVGEGIETYKVPYAEVEATNTKIAQAAGVDRRNMNQILRELRHALLIKPVEWNQKKMKAKGKKWVVYVLPVYSLALKDEEHGTYEVKNAEALDEVCRMIYEICRSLSQEKSDSVPEDVGICRDKKSEKKSNKRSLSNTNIINNTINTKCGSTEIPQSESSLDPGDPGSLTSRSDAPVRSPETPVRESEVVQPVSVEECKRKRCSWLQEGLCNYIHLGSRTLLDELDECPVDKCMREHGVPF